jgi:hypothetical protein
MDLFLVKHQQNAEPYGEDPIAVAERVNSSAIHIGFMRCSVCGWALHGSLDRSGFQCKALPRGFTKLINGDASNGIRSIS